MTNHDPTPRLTWSQTAAVYLKPQVLAMLFLGFSAGLPLLLVFGTLSAWLRVAGIDRSTIGFISWVAILYGFKFVWAPLVDRLPIPLLTRRLGQRRSWIIVAQIGVMVGLLCMAAGDPKNLLSWIVLCALLVAFFSATQDISVDAWRIEATSLDQQGAMAGMYQLGYRLSMLLAGGGAFSLAHFYSWNTAYFVMAIIMLVGVGTTLFIAEPTAIPAPSLTTKSNESGSTLLQQIDAWLARSLVEPFTEFFSRYGAFALIILIFVGLYRISDIALGVMANPFYIDMGYSELEIGVITKTVGPFITIAGGLLGGVLVMRLGVMRMLVISGILVVITNLIFAWLALQSPTILFLSLVIGADNLSGGIAGSTFIAYLSGLTNRMCTATQYALLSSLMLLPAKFLGGFSGAIVEKYNYVNFFIYTAALGIPAILLAIYLWHRSRSTEQKRVSAL